MALAGVVAWGASAWGQCPPLSEPAEPGVPGGPCFFQFQQDPNTPKLGSFGNDVSGFFDREAALVQGRIPEFDRFRNEASAAIDSVPIPSGSTSVAYTYDPKLETLVRWERPFAPALSQNSRTNGRGVLTIGTSYSYLDYRRFDDEQRSAVPLAAFSVRGPNGQPITDSQGRPAVDAMLFQFMLRQSIFGVTFQYGVLDWWDVGLFVPIIDQRFRGSAIERFFLQNPDGSLQPALVRVSTGEAEEDPNGAPPVPNIRRLRISSYDEPGDPENPLTGDRFDDNVAGVGDLVIRNKFFFGSVGMIDAGGLVNVVVPTGSEDDLLGLPGVRVEPKMAVSSGTARYAVHTNFGFHADTDDDDRSRFDYSVGGELVVTRWATLLVDQVGRLGVASDSTQKFELIPGVKVNPFRDLVVGFNGIIPLNHEGLTTDWIPNATADMSFRF
jgi:hypothetical protein